MTFRQNSFLFAEYLFMALILFVVAIFLIPFFLGAGTMVLLCVLFLISILEVCLFANILASNHRVIEINELGIKCINNNKILWIFNWEEIESLSVGRRYGNPSIEIRLHCNSIGNLQGKEMNNGYYFQLGRKAKQAIDKYYTRPIT